MDNLKEYIRGKFIFLFLDYDGTLTSIVDTPDKAIISQETKEILQRLSKVPNSKLAIISGRALEDIKEKVGIEGIVYVGNHGAEIEGPKIKFKSLISLKQKAIFEQIKNELTNKLSKIKGASVEDKGYSLSIHYRLVQENNVVQVKRIVDEAIKPFADKIKKSFGKRILELKLPGGWDKGKIVLWLLARVQFISGKERVTPIYLGDDVTDEDAFRVLKNKGLTIFVGIPKDSYAQYYLKNTEEVKEFLGRVLELRNYNYA